MTKKDKANASTTAAAAPLKIGDEVYLISDLTPGEYSTLLKEFRRQCLEKLVSPLQAIMDDLKKLPPNLQQMAIEAAVQQQSGGGSEPTREMLLGQLQTAEGVQFHIWMMARKNHQGLQLAHVPVFESNYEKVSQDAWDALHPGDLARMAGGDEPGKAQPTQTGQQ